MVEAMTTLPDKLKLREAFDQAISDINHARGRDQLSTPFYRQVGDAVFNASFAALVDGCDPNHAQIADTDRNRLHLISAPVGSGKSSFTIAFLAAVARTYPEIGCLLAVDQIVRADNCYRQLKALIPGKVAIWTVDHDPSRRSDKHQERKVQVPVKDRFRKDDLKRYPVIICTHAQFVGKDRTKVRNWIHGPRLFNAIDERLQDWITWDIQLSQVRHAQELVADRKGKADKVAAEHLGKLFNFMVDVDREIGNCLSKPNGNPENPWTTIANELEWFATDEAQRYNSRLGHYSDVRELVRNTENATAEQRHIAGVFGFARGLTQGCAFATGGPTTHFLAYEPSRPLPPGCMLLDATADIDHLNEISLWRKPHKCPSADYSNLTLVALSMPKQFPNNISEWLSKSFYADENRAAYAEWINQVVNRYLEPNQRGLIVSHRVMFANSAIPRPPKVSQDDLPHPRDTPQKAQAKSKRRFETAYYLPSGNFTLTRGKRCGATYWGTSIGANDWQDADCVFLFSEFWQRTRTLVATTHAIYEMKADDTEGDLKAMTTLSSDAPKTDLYWDGHRKRHRKQLGLRGNARNYDANGRCGTQTLVIACSDTNALLQHKDELFPGHVFMDHTDHDTKRGLGDIVLAALSTLAKDYASSRQPGDILSTQDLARAIGCPDPRIITKHLPRRKHLVRAWERLGWLYQGRAGKNGSFWEWVGSGQVDHVRRERRLLAQPSPFPALKTAEDDIHSPISPTPSP
jgi:hypothetical protein